MFQNSGNRSNSGGGGFGNFQSNKNKGGNRGFGNYNSSNSGHRNNDDGYKRRNNNRGRGGYNNRRGGGYRGRGGRGRGGRRGGGLKLAHDICTFSGALEAHMTPQKLGVVSMSVWGESEKIFTGGSDGQIKMFDFNGNMITEQPDGDCIGSTTFKNGWLFVGYLAPGAPGQQVGFVKGYNFTKPAVETANFALSPEFPAAHHAQINSICINGDMVLTASLDRTVKVWKLNVQINQWAMVGAFGGNFAHEGGVMDVFCSMDKTFTGDDRGELKVWDSSTGNQLNAISAHNGAIHAITGWENGDMRVILTCSADSTVKVWELSSITNQQVQPIFTYQPRRQKPFTCFCATKLSDGRHVLFCGYQDGSIQAFDLPDFSDLGFLDGHRRNNPITCLAHHNNVLFAGSMDGNLNSFSTA